MRRTFPPIPSSQITPEPVWLARRQWLAHAGMGALGVAAVGLAPSLALASASEHEPATIKAVQNPAYRPDIALTDESDVTSYNNFYEFGTAKSDPARYAPRMQIEPWAVNIEGELARPMTLDLDGLRKLATQEERIYRLRCVEGWSMVIPWVGYSLSHLLKHVRPNGNAKYVEFVTASQPENMPGMRGRIIDWPYVEGLRMDEAMHPLTMLVFGMYGKELPPQNGAPLRLVVPWKYGFKSSKSIVKIRLREDPPSTSWTVVAPQEYGFYANVNPDVPHPRWSQATERRIGAGLFAPRAPTQPFNGYADEVASLYAGMDLTRFY